MLKKFTKYRSIKFVVLILICGILNLSFKSAQNNVILQSGSSIALEAVNTTTSKEANVGQMIDFRVRQDVTVDGKVVVKAGTIAAGQIVRSSKAKGIGKEGFIEVQIRSVKAVDGQDIVLTGSNINQEGESKQTLSIVLGVVVCLLFLLIKGKDAVIPAGYSITATSAVSTNIVVK